MLFEDRKHAARLLAGRLTAYKGKNPLVLAIPRGGVPMGRVIADALEGELDVVLVHKLGAPYNPEFAIGSVSEEGHVELGPYSRDADVTEAYLRGEIAGQLQALRDRRALYTPVKAPAEPAGRVVIVVDDGLATGFTMLAALQSLKLRKPARLVAAFAVSPPVTLERVKRIADEVVCLEAPEDLVAVGKYFRDFSQVTDEEAIELLLRRKDIGRRMMPEVTP